MGKDLGPERGIAELGLYDRIGWHPHTGQQTIVRARARHRIVSAGRRFGKSQVGGNRLIKDCLDTRLVQSRLKDLKKRREYWIVGPSYTDSEKEYRVGDIVQLQLGYFSTMRAFTSEYVEKVYLG